MACFEPRRVEGIKLEITDAFFGCGAKIGGPISRPYNDILFDLS